MDFVFENNLKNIKNALAEVVDGHLSFGQAAEKYSVPKITRYNKYRGNHSDRLGKPPVLSVFEEGNVVKAMVTTTSYGYPFTKSDIKNSSKPEKGSNKMF